MIDWIKKNRLYAGLIGGVGVVLLVVLIWQGLAPVNAKPSTILGLTPNADLKQDKPKVVDFDTCKRNGNPVLESYPEKCIWNGQTFVRELSQEEIEKLKSPAPKEEPKKAEKVTYTSLNYPNFKFSYNSDWTIDKSNVPFPSKDKQQKDETGKDMVIGVITLTKGNYEVEFQLVPVWDFGGYGPGVNCTKNDEYNKVVSGRMARLQNYMLSEAEKQFGIKNPGLGDFKYSYVYIDDVEQFGEERFKSHFDGKDGPGSYPGKPNDYFACYIQSRETGAGLITSNYKQNGKFVEAAVLARFKIKGENRNADIFKEVDNMVLSAVGKPAI